MRVSHEHHIYEFGGFYLDTDQRLLLTGEGERVPLTSRAFDALAFMVAHPGELLDADTLMQVLWPGITVEENNLQQIITALRRALGEKPDDHRFIVTSRGRGYRFVAPVNRVDTLPGATPEEAARPGWRPAVLGMVGALGLVFLVLAGAGLWSLLGSRADDASSSVVVSAVPSIAVLPFVDLSADGDQAYFSHGIAEELLNQLARLEGVRVAGRTSSFSFEGTDTDLKTVARTLGVGHILQGSVRKEGNRVRINARLVDTADGYQRWSKTFERELGDIFAIQDEIARAVTGALSIALDIDARNRLVGAGTENFEAYDNYLAATESLRSATDLQEARLRLTRAVALDPNYAAAWAALALANGQLIWRVVEAERGPVLAAFETAAKRGAALDPQLSDARVMMGQYHVSRDEWLQAEAQFKAAMSLSSTTQPAGGYATLLARTGRIAPALAHINLALEGDPLHALNFVWRALILGERGEYDAAMADMERCEELGYSADGIAGNRLMILLNTGDRDRVRRQLEWIVAQGALEAPFLQELLADFDVPERAIARLRDAYADKSEHGPGTRSYIAILAAYFGDPEFALEVMSEEVRDTAVRMLYLWFPVFSDMRQLPAFKTLVRELNLVDYWRQSGWPDACRPLGADDFACS